MGNAYRDIAAARLLSIAAAPRLLLMRGLGDAVLVSVETVAPLVLVQRFGSLGGWSAAEVALLIGIARAGEGLALVFGRGVDPTAFSETVRLGRFDNVLTRPVSPLGWLLTSDIEVRHVFRTIAAGGVVVWAARAAGVAGNVGNIALLTASALAVSLLVLSILVLGAAFTFLTVEGSEIANLFANGGLSLVSFPLDIYGGALRFVFTFLIPTGLCVYVPVVVVLGRDGAGSTGPALLPLLPIVLGGFVATAALGWSAGLRRYQSTGS